MIKILKEGNLVEKTCEKCGCLFQFDKKEDIEIDKIDERSINMFTPVYKKEYIECPQCKEEIVLSKIIIN